MNAKSVCGWQEIAHIVGHNRFGRTVDCGLQDQFIVGIGELRFPLVIDPHGLDKSGEISKDCIQFCVTESVNRTLLGPGQHIFIFKEEGRCSESKEAPVLQQTKQAVARSRPAAERGNDYGCVENETHLRRVSQTASYQNHSNANWA